jgi:hypothetical protein
MTGSAIAGRITPGSAGAQLEACSRERCASAEGTDKNMCRIGGWYALFSAIISQYNSFRLTLRALGPDAALYARAMRNRGALSLQNRIRTRQIPDRTKVPNPETIDQGLPSWFVRATGELKD